MKAAIYARVSTQEQGDGYSIPAQIDLCNTYARTHGMSVVREYVDIGHSGGTTDRPQLTQMLLDARAGEFEVVVSKNPDRLARGVEIFIPIQSILTPAGVRIEFVEEVYRDDPMSQAMLQIRQVVAGLERKMTAIRVHASKAQKAKSGKVNVTPTILYGYDYDPATQTYVVNEQEAHWVRWMFREYVEGTMPRAIANALNTAYHVPTKSHSKNGWESSNISMMFTKTEYIGEGWANTSYYIKGDRERGIKGRTVHRPQEEWIRVHYPPIIDRETFEAAQARRERNKVQRVHNRARVEYLLPGKLFCAECGMKFLVHTFATTDDGKERVYRYYRCSGMVRHPHLNKCRPKERIRADKVEDAAWEAISKALSDPIGIAVRAVRPACDVRRNGGSVEDQVREVEGKLQELATQRSRLVASVAAGVLEDHEVAPQIKAIREQAEHWESQRARLGAVQEQSVNVQALADAMLKVWAEWLTVKEWTLERKKEAIRDLVDRVTLDGQGNIAVECQVTTSASGGSTRRDSCPQSTSRVSSRDTRIADLSKEYTRSSYRIFRQ